MAVDHVRKARWFKSILPHYKYGKVAEWSNVGACKALISHVGSNPTLLISNMAVKGHPVGCPFMF